MNKKNTKDKKKEKNPQALKPGQKISIERDYSRGIEIRFDETFPDEFEGLVDPTEFTATITQINHYFEEAEKANIHTFMEGCLGCLTFFSIYCCVESRYDKYLRAINHFIQSENDLIYKKKGLKWLDPSKNGFLTIDILVLDPNKMN